MRISRYKKLESAAREVARRRGVVGRTGGWLYDRKGARLCHGFWDYGRLLVREGAILKLATSFVVTEDADAYAKAKKPARAPRPAPAWRARQ